MDKAKKFLRKLSNARQDELDGILLKIERGDTQGLDVKKLKGHKNLFRVRVGDAHPTSDRPWLDRGVGGGSAPAGVAALTRPFCDRYSFSQRSTLSLFGRSDAL